jgi:hypothetical protein
MPCTRKIDDRYEVTIRSDPLRRGGWESEGDIYNSETREDVGVRVRGQGRTMPAAEDRAFGEARRWCFEHRMGARADRSC